MPRKTKTYNLKEEAERIDTELDEVAATVSNLEEGNPGRNEKVREGRQLERELAGLQWALNPEEDEDREPYEEVTVGALTAAEYANASDRASDAIGRQKGNSSSEWLRRLYFASAGVVSAPWLDEDDASFEDKLTETNQVAPQFLFWLESVVDEITTPRVEGNGFAQRVEANLSGERPN